MRELEICLEMSRKDGVNCSFVARSGGEIAAIRISYPPGNWINGKKGRSQKEWGVAPDKTGYFQSLFVAEKHQGQDLGKRLSALSIKELRKAGAKAVVCHCWLESPRNSSRRYLESMGFAPVKKHPFFWGDRDYLCSGCGKTPCGCGALEMIKRI